MTLADLFDRYRVCMARIDAVAEDGTAGVGAAFHIGDGWFVTAEHCVKDRKITVTPYRHWEPAKVKRMILSGRPDDLALIETDFSLDHYMTRTTIVGKPEGWKVDHVEIGGHLNDWIDNGLNMTQYLVMGYPRTPSGERVLVADGGFVAAVVDPPLRQHPYFLLSGQPRPGYSGGPVLSEYGFLLGVLTDAFPPGDPDLELHHPGVISVEPLWDLLLTHGVYPGSNGDFAREYLDPLWETARRMGAREGQAKEGADPGTGQAIVDSPAGLRDDGYRQTEQAFDK